MLPISVLTQLRRATAIPLFLLLAAIFAPAGGAYPIIFATGPTTIPSGAPDNAEAIINFDTSLKQITISLLNLQLDPKGITGAISGVEVDFANLSGTLTSSQPLTTGPITGTASTFTINSDGSITGAATSSTTAWLAETNASDAGAGYAANTLALCVVCKNVNGTSPPTELVIGGPATNKPSPYGYADGNSSITTNHSPYILGSGSTFTYAVGTPLAGMDTTPTWVLTLPTGVQANTTITAVRFYFGSAYIVPGQEADATIEITPEPGPVTLVVGGLLLITAGRWKRGKTR